LRIASSDYTDYTDAFSPAKKNNPLNPLNPMIKYLRAQREETLYKSNKFDDKNIQAQPTIN